MKNNSLNVFSRRLRPPSLASFARVLQRSLAGVLFLLAVFAVSAQAQVQDTTPDAFSFSSLAKVDPGTQQISNAITVSGVSQPVAISVTSGAYSVNGGEFTTSAGTVGNGGQVRLRITSSTTFSGDVSAQVRIGTVSASFKVKTRAADAKPEPFSFASVTNVAPGSLQTSGQVTLTGFEVPAPITVTSGGAYSLNDGPFQTAPGQVRPGDRLRVQLVASTSPGVQVRATVEINDADATFRVTTSSSAAPPPDTSPDPFTFPARINVEPNTFVESQAIDITGINQPAPVFVTGGEYSVNGGAFTSAAGQVPVGGRLVVRLLAPASYEAQATATLVVGGFSATFTVTTLPPPPPADTTPDAFSFEAATDVQPGTLVSSAAVTIAGTNQPAAVTVVGGEYSINGGEFTSAAGEIAPGGQLVVRVLAASGYAESSSVTVSVGDVSATFTATTVAEPPPADTTPDAFSFEAATDVQPGTLVSSAAVTIAGTNQPAAVTVVGGEYSINGGEFTSAAGEIAPGGQLVVRVLAASGYAESSSVTVSVGDVSATFTATTVAEPPPADTTPDAFGFAPVVGVVVGSEQISQPITVTGIDAASAISVIGGSYSIDGATFVDTPGTVVNGQTVRLKVIASSTAATTTSAVVTIGGVSAGYSVTTADPSISVADVSVSEGNAGSVAVSFVVSLSPVSSAAVTVPYAIEDGSATTADNDYVGSSGTLNFPAGTASQTITVNVNGDTRVEPNENFLVKLGVPTGATLGRSQATGTIVNDDSAVPTVSIADASTLEGSSGIKNLSFTLTLSPAASTTVTVRATTSNGTATSGSDYNGGALTLTFAPGETTKSGTVGIRGDADSESDETFFVTLSAPTGGAVIGRAQATGTILNDDAAADTTPDAFSFPPQVDVEPAVLVSSSPATISGIAQAAPVVVAGGAYSVNGGGFTTAAGTVPPGGQLVVRVLAPSGYGEQASVTVTVGGVSATFTVTTLATAPPADTTPNAFVFPSRANVDPGAFVQSQAVSISGTNQPAPIQVTGGEYSLNGGPFTSAAGEVPPGSSVVVRILAPGSFETQVSAFVSIGGVSAAFTITTAAVDTVPDAFVLGEVVAAQPLSEQQSNEIVVAGINSATAISVSGGRYAINGAAFTDSPGTVLRGDRIRVKAVASTEILGVVVARLTIGGVSADFRVTTAGPTVGPAPFSFNEVNDAYPRLAAISQPVTPTGFTSALPITVSNGLYSINGAAFVSTPGVVYPGDQIRAYAIPAALNDGIVTATVRIGDVTAPFRVRTQAPLDTFPDYFRFDDERLAPLLTWVVSNTVTVRGINAPSPVTTDPGTEYSINEGPFTSAPGSVLPGDRLRIRYFTPDTRTTELASKITIGGFQYPWSLKTTPKTPTSQPDPFRIVPATIFSSGRVLPGSEVFSKPIVITGASALQNVRVTGGEYSINNGPFTTANGTAANGDRIVVKMTSSTTFGGSKSMSLVVGMVSASFSIATTLDAVASTSTEIKGASASYVFRDNGVLPLRIFVFLPRNWRASDRRSAYIDWFGGGWVDGDPANSAGHAQFWASEHGMVTFAPDYRTNSRFGTPAQISVDDARAAVKWVQENAAMFGIDPARVVVAGSSAGGGNALWTALKDAPAGTSPASSPIQRPAAVVMRCGVADTTAAFSQGDARYLRFMEFQDPISPLQSVDPDMPPIISFHGDHDDVVSQSGVVNLCSKMRQLGRDCEMYNQPGLDHYWFGAPGTKEASREQTRQFFLKHGLLPAER